jgi:hypothetical protein
VEFSRSRREASCGSDVDLSRRGDSERESRWRMAVFSIVDSSRGMKSPEATRGLCEKLCLSLD